MPPPLRPPPRPPGPDQHVTPAQLNEFLASVIPAAAASVRDEAHRHALARAFHDPAFTVLQGDGRERRYWGGVFVVVGANEVVVFIGDADHPREIAAVEADERRAGRQRDGQPRAKGGRGGSRRPTSCRELLERLTELGFTYSIGGGGHYRVVSPNGEVMPPIPNTASDWRSVANTVSDYRRRGVDLNRRTAS